MILGISKMVYQYVDNVCIIVKVVPTVQSAQNVLKTLLEFLLLIVNAKKVTMI